jgi:beta-glucanase (GH16 family)
MLKTIIILAILISFSNCLSSDSKQLKTTFIIINDMVVDEGNGGDNILDFTVSLSEKASEDILINYYTEDASAFQSMDYIKSEGQIIIPKNSKSVTISIEIISDNIKEGDEVFRLKFDPINKIEFSQTEALIIIKNDDTMLPYSVNDYITPESYEGWKLVWRDEFDENEVNKNWWTYEIGNGINGWGNNEIQYYTDATINSRVENSQLIIEAHDDYQNGKEFTSARIITKNKKSFGFGRIDIRAKLPYGQGIWPAIWMLGNNIDEIGWPACGEIDIMELIGNHASTSHATVHFGSDFPNHKYKGENYAIINELFNERFHVFSVIREVDQMWFFVDDILIFDFNSRDTQGMPYPFNKNFFLILNVAVGGNWPGNPDRTTQFPQQLIIDYIREFEKNQ